MNTIEYALGVSPKCLTSLNLARLFIVESWMAMSSQSIDCQVNMDVHFELFQFVLTNENIAKINPLVCAPIGAHLDEDSIHIFHSRLLAAKSDAKENSSFLVPTVLA